MRGGIKRSRNGCANCKEKRLKCDEEKPSCRRCIKKGIQCTSKGVIFKQPNDKLGIILPQSPNDAVSSMDCTISTIEDAEGLIPMASFPDAIYDFSAFNETLYDPMPPYDSIDIYSEEHNAGAPRRNSGMTDTSMDGGVPITNNKLMPHLVQFPMSQTLTDQSSVLVEYYFKEVAGLFSCYDGSMNPFRSNVSQLWGSSASIYYTVQSMSAACLIDIVPDLAAKGSKLREKATAAIELELSVPQPHTGSLLALIMLGLTSSWHESGDLGRAEFDRAHRAFTSMQDERRSRLSESKDRNFQFFQKALLYWEMLMSYVAEDQGSIVHQLQAGPVPLAIEDRIGAKLPHPWTGVACDAQNLVFEVGKLIRQRKKRHRRRSFSPESGDEQRAAQDLYIAEDLKNRLQCLSFPDIATIVDPGDMESPVFHFLKIAECYRDTGLLQLYRVFPELLPCSCVLAGVDADETLPSSSKTSTTPDEIMISLAMRVVNILKSIPIESGYRCVQPFLLVAVASELHIPDFSATVRLEKSDRQLSEYDELCNTMPSAIEVLEARKFVLSRLSFLEHVLPAKPIRQMLNVMRETWRRMDDGNVKVYWMDIMMEKGWETIMG